jgi:hypothetical protein
MLPFCYLSAARRGEEGAEVNGLSDCTTDHSRVQGVLPPKDRQLTGYQEFRRSRIYCGLFSSEPIAISRRRFSSRIASATRFTAYSTAAVRLLIRSSRRMNSRSSRVSDVIRKLIGRMVDMMQLYLETQSVSRGVRQYCSTVELFTLFSD